MACGVCFGQVGVDPRPVMRAAYELFQRGGNPDEVRSREHPVSGIRYANANANVLPSFPSCIRMHRTSSFLHVEVTGIELVQHFMSECRHDIIWFVVLQLVGIGAGDNGGHDSFYSLLYAGLFYEAMVILLLKTLPAGGSLTQCGHVIDSGEWPCQRGAK